MYNQYGFGNKNSTECASLVLVVVGIVAQMGKHHLPFGSLFFFKRPFI